MKLSPQEILILLDGLSKIDAGWLQLIVVHLKNRLKEEYEKQTGNTLLEQSHGHDSTGRTESQNASCS